jgi:hypothetical protein
MKKPVMCILIFLVLLCLFAVNYSFCQESNNYPDTSDKVTDHDRTQKAKNLVLTFTRLILQGNDVDSILAICAVPFSWDRNEIISDFASLKNALERVIQQKGKGRQFFPDTVFIKKTRKEILDNIIPLDLYCMVIKIKNKPGDAEKSDEILFAVQMSDEPKIIGFSD